MLRFIAGRLAQSLAVMLVVVAIAFALFQYVGDPLEMLMREDASQAEIDRMRTHLGLDRPIVEQFVSFVGRAVRGDFGMSYHHRRPVSQLLVERFPATFELAGLSMILSLLVGIPFGVYTGLHRNGRLARALMAVSLIGISVPTFVVGILLIYIFAVNLGWLPSYGRGEVIRIAGGWWSTGLLTPSGLRALVLPVLTLTLFKITLIMRLVRAEMLDVMRTDYVRFARARGINAHSIHYRHALKNALMPVVTIVGLQLGAVIAFAIITETVFQWPGMGRLFMQAIQTVDIPVMSAYLMVISFFFVTINLIVDMLYFLIDPRLRSRELKGAANA
jgi:peptide/nickel transport system permease protein